MAEGMERIHERIDKLQEGKADKSDVDALRSDIAKVIEGQHQLAIAIRDALGKMPIQPCRDLMTLRQRHEVLETTVMEHIGDHRSKAKGVQAVVLRVAGTVLAALLIAGAGYAAKAYIDSNSTKAP